MAALTVCSGGCFLATEVRRLLAKLWNSASLRSPRDARPRSFTGDFMADAPQPSSDTKESDKKMRERVDKLIAQAASESSGAITLGAKSLDYIVSAAFLPVVAGGLEGA